MKKYNFTINGNNYNVIIKNIDGDIAKVELNGSPLIINLNQEIKTSKTPVLTRKEVVRQEGENKEKLSPVKQDVKPSATHIKSPLPGSVIKVLVKEGDTFKTDDVLMVLESMKMENNILAERGGKILKVHINAGQAILQDAVLFDIE